MIKRLQQRDAPPSGRLKKLIRWIKWILLIGLPLLAIATIWIGAALYRISRDLPSIDALKNYQPSQATRVYSDDNQVIGEFFIQKREVVPLSKIPKETIQAFLAVEDAHFYEHHGLDFLRMIRAALTNLENFKIMQGASTITQQLTRSLFLTPERTYERKIKEILLTWKIESLLTKDQILEIYLNQIYFGHGAYGIQVAARTYFAKQVKQIRLEEGAFLAGLPKAPNNYSPYRHPEKAKERQKIVLKRMLNEKFITQTQYDHAIQTKLLFQKLAKEGADTRYFLDYVRQYLIDRYGEEALYTKGMHVYTTLNMDFQKSATRALEFGLREVDKRQGYRGGGLHPETLYEQPAPSDGMVEEEILDGQVSAVTPRYALVTTGKGRGKILLEDMLWARRQLKGGRLRATRIEQPMVGQIVKTGGIIQVKVKRVGVGKVETLLSLEQEPLVEGAVLVLDQKTGAIRAMVGGYDYNRSEFNRAVSAHRQPGSAFKGILYAAALEQGFTPASVEMDSPVIYANAGPRKEWKPQNYEGDFAGPTRLREALVHSRNLVTIRLLEKMGVSSVIDLAQRLGIQSPLTRDLSLALGTSGITLMELTSAYGVFANHGVRQEPFFIKKVTGPKRHILESSGRAAPVRVLSEATAYVMTNMLADVIRRGTGRRAAVIDRPIAGKTGTTNDYTDALFVGFSPNLVAGVWVGFDDNQSLGSKESGAQAALPIWITFMEEALLHYVATAFPIPEGIIYARIDPQTGLLAPDDQEDAINEVFVRGTEPTMYKSNAPEPSQFFELDAEEEQR